MYFLENKFYFSCISDLNFIPLHCHPEDICTTEDTESNREFMDLSAGGK